MPGSRLSSDERLRIAHGLVEGLSYAEVGRRLGRPASTVLREVARNGGRAGYRAARADRVAREGPPRGRAGHEPALEEPRRSAEDVRDFARDFMGLLVDQGMPRVAAGILALLYVADDLSATAPGLAGQLGVSPASISVAVGFLEGQGLISRRRVAGTRGDRFTITDDVWSTSIEATVRTNDVLIEGALRGVSVLGSETPAGRRFENAAELLSAVNDALRRGMDDWRRSAAAR